MINIIIGKRSDLSLSLKKKINNSKIYTVNELKEKKINAKFNLIINSFYSSLKLSEINNYENFYKKSIYDLSILLDILPYNKINKIIYTSSSSVYNSIDDRQLADHRNRKIYSSTKLAAENLIKNFCSKYRINFSIVRLFNLFGGDDKFSIISKIINSYKKKNNFLNLINKGETVRDFIHIDDVTYIYSLILKQKKSGIVDVGRGYGIKISNILETLKYKNFNIKKHKGNEAQFSVANNIDFNLNEKNSLENYLQKKLKLKNKVILDRIFYNNSNLIYKSVKGSIIYGAGIAGRALLKAYKKKGISNISYLVDDNIHKFKNKFIDGVEIISFNELITLSKEKIISNIIIAIPSLSTKKLDELIRKISNLALNITVVENDFFAENKYLTLSDMNETIISNLFRRKIKKKILISKNLKNKIVLVTGAGGSIGSELVVQLLISGSIVIALDHSELALYNLKKKLDFNYKKNNLKIILGSINDRDYLAKIKKIYKINVIFHAAAYKHVNILENNVELAIQNNIFGTLNLLQTFNSRKFEIIVISTDKAVKPISILGATKRISEIISQDFQKKDNYFSKIKIVRFGNVFGSQGSAIELFINQLNTNQEITITDFKVKRYFMSIKEACNLVLSVTRQKKLGRIYILNMGKQILVKNIIEKLAELKKVDKLKLKIKEIGLQKGEKLNEELSINKKLIKTNNNEIYIANEPIYSHNDVNELLNKINENIYIKKDYYIKKLLFNFLYKEK